MKKALCLLLAVSLCFALFAGCDRMIDIDPPPRSEPEESTTEPTVPSTTEAPTTEEPSTELPVDLMAELQQQLYDEGCLAAVAYLGSCEGNFMEIQDYLENSGLAEALPLLKELTSEHFVETEGLELYFVVTRDDVGVTVYRQGMDEDTYELTWEESLYVGYEPTPLLLRGNVSEIVPNLGLFIEGQGGETLDYYPSLSMEDGHLNGTRRILDLTPYDTIPGGTYIPEDAWQMNCVGSWFGRAVTVEGEEVLLELILNYDGSASYGYGPQGEMFYEFFEGTWWLEGEDTLCLSLYGGNLYDAELQYEFYGEFLWDYAFHKLGLTHSDGYSLIYGLEGGALWFTSSSRYALVGMWRTTRYDSSTDSYFYQDLELLEDGSCYYLSHNGEGNTDSVYSGTWEEKDGELTLNMEMYSGSAYQEGEEQLLAGSYHAVIDADGWLTLYLLDGNALTQYMYDSGMDFFEPTVSYG